MIIRFNLSHKIAALAFVTAGVSVLGIAYLAYVKAENLLYQQAVNVLSEAQKVSVYRLNGAINTVKEDMMFLSRSGPMNRISNPDTDPRKRPGDNTAFWRQRLIGLFDVILQQRQAYEMLYYVDKERGIYLGNIRQGKGVSSLTKKQILQMNPPGLSTHYPAKSGKIFFSEITSAPLNMGEGAISYPRLQASMSVFSDNNEMYGTIALIINFSKLIENIVEDSPTRFYFVTDSKGEYLFLAGTDFVKNRINFESLWSSFPETEPDEFMKGDDEEVIADIAAKNLVVDMRKIRYGTGQNTFYIFGSGSSVDLLKKDSKELRNELYLVVIGVVLLLSILIAVVTKYLTRPLLQLSAVANRIAGGEKAEIPAYADDEIGYLAQSLRTMLEHLELLRKDKEKQAISLERMVNERTEELSQANIALHSEIHERKLAQQELKRSHDLLEKRVEERTKRLAETYNKLLHTEKLGAVGLLSASIAHEFGSPIFAIRNLLESLRAEKGIRSETGQLLDLAIQECDRLSGLMKNLQDFHSPTSGIKTWVDVHLLLESVILLLQKQFETRKIAVSKHFSQKLPLIMAIEDQIKQVFLNLFTNADDAIGPNGGEIVITTGRAGKMIKIDVEDNGTGIQAEDLERIFEPFVSTKDEKHGTGLGLSISYGIVKSHGGDILVESAYGSGSRFTVLLPVNKENNPDQAPFSA